MGLYALEDAIAAYTLYARAKGYSQKTINDQILNVRSFCRFLDCQDLATVNGEDLQRFTVYLREKKTWSGTAHARERPLSATSINTYFRSIRSFWNWMLGSKIISVNPLLDVPTPKLPKPLPKALTEDKLRSVIQTVSDNILEKTLIFVLTDSGVRLSGLIRMTVDAFDLTIRLP